MNRALVIKISQMFCIAVRIHLENGKIELDLACCKYFPH